MNKVFLIGNLTRDPEGGTTASGISYSRFTIAVNRRFSKDKDEVDFLNIVCWRGLADTCNRLLSKGKKVAVCGSIQIRNYEDKNGDKRTSTDIVAEEVEFLTPLGNSAKEDFSNSKKTDDITQLTPVSEDLPF